MRPSKRPVGRSIQQVIFLLKSEPRILPHCLCSVHTPHACFLCVVSGVFLNWNLVQRDRCVGLREGVAARIEALFISVVRVDPKHTQLAPCRSEEALRTFRSRCWLCVVSCWSLGAHVEPGSSASKSPPLELKWLIKDDIPYSCDTFAAHCVFLAAALYYLFSKACARKI